MSTLLACLPAVVMAGDPDAPTPLAKCREAIELLQLTPESVLYDLGCGDGRICILAAETVGCRAVGIDLDAGKVQKTRRIAESRFVGDLVTFYQGDVLQVDYRQLPITHAYVYLPQDVVVKLTLILQQRKGLVVVSYLHPLKAPHKFTKHGFYVYRF